ncbi:electron transport complex subunit RsxC [Natronospirillum operosum]|uniref:Ion-translocating oxidoreductase complex subunit C n=1 Tax=Natronospirillum operosum TaxID=2759953 RepID=A0A4Z0WI68_9GAMM|nr:electron transport complex subunit RsxC [Natronospirillum operosum]TGG95321.1 electron transport complex subunit RsxC [Natronospirillum operosum]
MNLMRLLRGDTDAPEWYDFPGGVHPPENKTQSLRGPIAEFPLQEEYVVPLNQHIGAVSVPVVEVGESVLTGQVIAEAAGFISAPAHAPTSGTVTAIEDRPVPHPSGLTTGCIIIRADGHDTWRPRTPWAHLQDHHHTDLLARIQNAGLTGLGGASFPTAVKLAADRNHVDTLIVNGTECEPYITADHALMRERPQQILRGIEVAHELYDFRRILIGVEDNKPDAVSALRRALTAIPAELEARIELRVFPTRYPSGGEKQLVYLLTGQEVPAGGLPTDLGMLCHNVGTLAALADAVFDDRPLISRITTLTGNQLPWQGNIEVRLGTDIRTILDWAGYQPDPNRAERIIMGGPMMGFALDQRQLPLVKATNCLLVPTEQELPTPPPAKPCIRCGQCEQVCPAGLLPQQLMWFAQSHEWDKAESHHLFDCIECGACAYVCPSHIPLVQYYRFAKGSIRREQAEHRQSERARLRFEARQARLEREAAEKEARRRQRAEAARARQAEQATTPTADSSPADPVAAAVARSKARKQASQSAAGRATATVSPGAPELTREQLSARLDSQRRRLEKAEAKLAAAAPEHQKAMETTVSKLREQIHKTEQQLADRPEREA